jgi:meso-butanediol dehydrogenase/(S,S)-butanediol dehydrogenase/diacetyl reductase
MLLSDKVIFLTGGATGIGWECALAYAKEGARLAILDWDPQAAERASAELGDSHLVVRGDASSDADVKNALAETLSRFGQLDAIHNNAGIANPSKPLHETTDDEWDKLIAINLKSVLLTIRHGFEALKASRGCVLNTSSIVGVMGQEIHAAYSATKGGMNALTKSMALDYAKYHIRVNAVCPANVWSPLLRKWSQEQPDPAGMERYLNEVHPLGYCPEGDVIADACVFLISEKARFVTGHIMHVSGGAELGYRRPL